MKELGRSKGKPLEGHKHTHGLLLAYAFFKLTRTFKKAVKKGLVIQFLHILFSVLLLLLLYLFSTWNQSRVEGIDYTKYNIR